MVIFKHNLYKSTLSFRDYKLFILLTGTKQACQTNWCSKVKNLRQWPELGTLCILVFFFFKLILLAYSCFTFVLVSAVQQSESAMRMHISPLFLDFLPILVTTEPWVELPELCRKFSLTLCILKEENFEISAPQWPCLISNT